MRVRLTPRAQQRARLITKWWRDNRPGVDKLFEQELERIKEKLASMSSRSPLGTIYGMNHGATIWRVLLPRTEQHVYYWIDGANETVMIRMIWGARRGRTPRL